MMRKILKVTAVLMTLVLSLIMWVGCANGVEEKSDKSTLADSSQNSGSESEETSNDKQLLIGFSQAHSTSAWRVIQTENVTTALESAGHKMIYTDAQNNTQKQVADVEDILAQNPDYLVIAPREEDGLVPALEAAQKAGVPVILLDRRIKGEAGVDYVTYIGSDYAAAGHTAAEWLVENFDGKCNIVEIAGTSGATSTIERSKGFREALEGHNDMVILASQVGDSKRVEAQKAMENLLQAHGDNIDAVFVQSDEMAYGAVQAMKIQGIDPSSITICTMDGLEETLKNILDGEITISLYTDPRLGGHLINTINRIEKGEKVEPWVVVDNILFDAENAEENLKLLYSK